MTLGGSIFLLALGAILTFAVNATQVAGPIDIHAVGWILMAAGFLGLFLSLAVLGPRARARRTTVVDDRRDVIVPADHREIV
ncbi:MAG: hypothetical protein H7123_05190 [Thermoleophilia bacterium]|nr:hypothetical protein [Thermoleophilia bacterium]